MITLLGSSCVLCDAFVAEGVSLCKPCQGDLPVISHACTQCGIPLSESGEASRVCGQCLKYPPASDYSVSLYHYEIPIDYFIAQLKFSQQLSYAAILGFLLKEQLQQIPRSELPEVILPVPLHTRRLIKRGFNQSLEIARVVSKGLGIPIDYKCVKRQKATKAQSDLDVNQRKRNIKDCFVIEKVPAYQHIVIIDDVVTTGATSNELAKVLKKAGVKKVGVWSIARATLKKL